MKVTIIILSFLATVFVEASSSFVSLCYHDVTTSVTGNPYTIRPEELIQQFEYLKANGYNSISLDDLLAAQKGNKPLPDKAVLITVDDGLKSMYTAFYPILKAYGFKAVFAIVGRWTEVGYALNYEPYGDQKALMAGWDELKKMVDSGLVEVASHSYDLHRGVVFNPQANEAPAASYFRYSPLAAAYESDESFRGRIANDLTKNSDLLRRKLGTSPRAMVWPYGAFNTLSVEEASKAGMPIQLTVEEGINTVDQLSLIKRNMILSGTSLPSFAELLEKNMKLFEPVRGVHVSTEELYDENQIVRERNLGELVERIHNLGPNTAYLEGVDNKGKALFPTETLPVRADFVGRVAHQLLTRTKVDKLFVVLPSHLGPALPQLARELARNTHFHGVVIEGAISEQLAQSIKVALHTYRPLAELGVLTHLESGTTISDSEFDHFAFAIVRSKAKAFKPEKLVMVATNKKKIIIELLGPPKTLKSTTESLLMLGYPHFSYRSEPFANGAVSALRPLFSSEFDPFEWKSRRPH